MSKLRTEEADELVADVKSHFPLFQITRDDVLRPTSDVAVRFYNEFIANCQERLSLLVGTSLTDTDAELEIEDRVFQMISKMSNLFEKAGMTFLIGDIYEPTPIRMKMLFKICLHFKAYCEYIFEDVDRLGHDAFKMKESARSKGELEYISKKLSAELESVQKSHDECLQKNHQKQKHLANKKKEVKMLQCRIQKEEFELVSLEQQEKLLGEQTITEKEHMSLLQLLDKLETEMKSLGHDYDDLMEFLKQENDVLRHYEMCNKRVPDVSDEVKTINDMIALEDQLNDLQLTKETLLNKLSTTRQFSSQKKNQLVIISNILLKSQAELESLHKTICRDKEDLISELNRFKEENSVKLLTLETNISECNEEKEKVMSQMDKMKKNFEVEYGRVRQAEKQAIDLFSSWLEKHGSSQ